MDELNKAVGKALDMLKDEFETPSGIEALKEYGYQVILLNNCVLILGMNENELKIHFIGGKPFQMDKTVSIFEKN